MLEQLDDIQVIDFTHTVAGPVSTQLLSSLGAEVIKVEPPTGESGRQILDGAFQVAFGSDKRSIAVDLGTDEGTSIIQELVADADVLIQNFRPGTLEKYNLDYESVAETNPGIVYCSISGFGEEGPYADYPAYDPVVQAMSGVMSMTGETERDPVRVGTSGIDITTGILTAFLIVTALRERDKTGEGTHVETTLFESALYWMSYWMARYGHTDSVPKRQGAGYEGASPSNVFPTGDGELVMITALTDSLFDRLCAAIDREDLAANDRYTEANDRWTHREQLRAELIEEFQEYTADELVARLVEKNVPSGKVQDIGDIVHDDPHVAHHELITDVYNPTVDEEVYAAKLPYQMDKIEPNFEKSPPKLGEDTSDILAEMGYSKAEIDQLYESDIVWKSE